MSFEVKNKEWLRKLSPQSFEDLRQLGPRLYGALDSIQKGVGNIEQQSNADASAHPSAPPPISGVNVTAQDGIFHFSVRHDGVEFYRGIRYHAEYADNSQFTNPFPISMGESREWRGALGNLGLHFRFAASYGNTPPTDWVYFGSSANPTRVSGGGAAGPALPSQSQGSGTGFPGQGLQGPGVSAYRSANGVPPTRTQRRGTS